MPLSELQTVLARLYTDARFREQCRQRPESIADRFGLTPREKAQLQSLDWEAVERFARSLINKRLKLVKPHLPGTCALLGKKLFPIFSDYCRQFPSGQRLQGHEESLQFVRHLRSISSRLSAEPAYAGDVAAYEQTRLELMLDPSASEPLAGASRALAQLERREWRSLCPSIGPHLQVRRFDYPVDEFVATLASGDIVEATSAPTWILFVRRPRSHQVKARRIEPPTRRLLSLCRGREPTSAILEKLAAALKIPAAQRSALEAECKQFFRELAREGVLAFVERSPADMKFKL